MIEHMALTYVQSFCLLSSSSSTRADMNVNEASSWGQGDLSESPVFQSNILIKTTFSSVPTLWDYELALYRELGEALSELKDYSEEDDWGIEPAVFVSACFVAEQLISNGYPAPRVFSHGSKSIVFNWTNGSDNLYLTVSAERIAALISSPQEIKRRDEFTFDQLVGLGEGFSGAMASHWNQFPQKLLTMGTTKPELVPA